METAENNKFVYEFGKFSLDPQEKTLFSDGLAMHLPPKEFETLLLLVENNGRALSKDEMMASLWQDAFVEESNLAKQISRLRKIFNGDGAARIETLPKHGYRFSADLRQTYSEAERPVILERRTVKRVTVAYQDDADDRFLPPAVAETQRSIGWRRSSFQSLIFLVVLLGLVGSLSYLRFSSSSEDPVKGSAVRSVAVLPFKGVGAEDGNEHLQLGLTDALITKLSNLKNVIVRPTNAVRGYAAREPLAAGRELSVEAVLDGNVQRIGEQIRVTVQLVGVRDGRLLWGGKFDEKFTDIFSVQDAIAEQVAQAIEPGLTGEERSLLAKRYTTNADAHHAYVRGRYFWNKRTAEDLKEAVKHFNEAVARDPNYALAYVGLADTYSLFADYLSAPASESYDKARSSALKALELDDGLAEAHTSLAFVKMSYDWDWQGAETEYRQAIALNPNYATARHWYAEYLAAMGRYDDAIAEIRRAKEIDPLSPIINAGEVWILYFARRYDEAIEQGAKLIERSTEFAEVHEYLKRCYDQKGMYREAIAARQMRRKLAGLDPTQTDAIKRAAAAESQEIYWKSRLEQEIADSQREPPFAFDMAEIYSQLGDKDKAFEWLEKAFEERTYTLMYLKVAPNLDPLRSDPRFTDLLRRIGLLF